MGTKINASILDAIGFPGVGKKIINVQKDAKAKAGALLKTKEQSEKADVEAKLAALGAQGRGAAAKGQGGDGSLLTGAGGVKDPALTGKSTLLGAR